MKILYEDNHCIAVVKQHGMLTQGDASGDPSLLEEVKAFLKARDNKPGRVFLGLVHRLDRPVGGIVLFAKTSKGASRLSQQFREHRVKKTYLAVVEMPKVMRSDHLWHTVVQYLKKNPETNSVKVVTADEGGAQRAELKYRVLDVREKQTLVEVIPTTGRPHQIRVAMATTLGPIVGDTKYGARKKLDGAIALFASSVEFFQPVTGEPIAITTEAMLPIFKTFL